MKIGSVVIVKNFDESTNIPEIERFVGKRGIITYIREHPVAPYEIQFKDLGIELAALSYNELFWREEDLEFIKQSKSQNEDNKENIEFEAEKIRLGVYKHFTGNLYKVLGETIHSETNERMVIYKALHGNFKIYVRPYDLFVGKVNKEKHPKVDQEYRFEFIRQVDYY